MRRLDPPLVHQLSLFVCARVRNPPNAWFPAVASDPLRTGFVARAEAAALLLSAADQRNARQSHQEPGGTKNEIVLE